MPVNNKKIQKYGPPGETRVTVPLPWSLEKSDPERGSCKVTLSAISPAQPWDQAVDWNIWAAAVSIRAMCWRQGKSGTATVGINGRLTLSFDHAHGLTLDSTSVGNLTEF